MAYVNGRLVGLCRRNIALVPCFFGPETDLHWHKTGGITPPFVVGEILRAACCLISVRYPMRSLSASAMHKKHQAAAVLRQGQGSVALRVAALSAAGASPV